MASVSQTLWSHPRVFVSTVLATALAMTFLVADNDAARAEDEQATPVVGSFAVGGSVTAGVDEQSGTFTAQIPVGNLPGVGGSGAVNVGVSYSQDAAAAGGDPHGLGVGWSWGVPRVIVDSGVQVATPSGQVYSASEAPGDVGEEDSGGAGSGLEGYVQGDLVFSQTDNTFLDARDGAGQPVAYAYSLEHLGGVTDYFGAGGQILTRIDAFNYRSDWEWDGARLVGVTDAAGSEIVLNWSDTGVEIISPPRSDGVVASTVLAIVGNELRSITNPVSETVEFGYDESGLLGRVTASSGARTEITYQPLPNNHLPNGAKTVDEVRVVDSNTGQVLSKRAWNVKGDHNPQGSPKYSSAGEMWAAGDGSYRYQTVLTDGETSIESVYNSMGLMLSRNLTVSTPDGEYTAQEQTFTYTGTDHGGVPDKDQVPEQYAKPTKTTVTYRDNKGATRQVTEKTEFDKTGRSIKHTAANGSVTTTTYDTQKPVGPVEANQAGSRLPYGLVVNQTTTGYDGTVSETTNTLTSDRRAVQAIETRVAAPGAGLERTSRTELVVDADGFVVEQRIVAVGEITEGPESVVTRFGRTVDTDAKTVTISQTDAAGTDAESTTSTVTDLVTGLHLSAIDPTGRVATSTYDDAGRLLTHTVPGNLRTITEYEDKLTRVTDPTGVTKSERVDVLGRVVEVTDNITTTGDGVNVTDPGTKRVIETREYERNGSKVIVTDARGLKTITVTDVFDRPVSVTGPSGVAQIKTYDDVANTVQSGLLGPSGSRLKDALLVTTKQLDDSNRDTKTHSTRKDGVRVPDQSTTYDGLGRVTTQTSGDMSTSVVLNPNGTPKTTTMTPTETRTFPGQIMTADREHDLLGASTKKTLARADGQTRTGETRVLDAAGRTTQETDQTGQTTHYTYTVDGLVVEAHDGATGVITRNTYDEMTRALTRTETTGADGSVSRTQLEYHPVTGNMLSICDPNNCEGTRISYAYDVLGNTTTITYPDAKTIRHMFDQFGRKTSTTDTVGNITVYVYDKVGLLKTATQTSPDHTVLGQVTYTYDEYGRMNELSRGNGVTTRYTFTSANEIKTELTKHDTTVILDAAYEYDTHGNLTKRTDTRPDGVDTSKQITETTVYAYNAYDQLVASRSHPCGTAPGDTTHTLQGRNVEPSLETMYDIGVSGEVTKETTTTGGTTTVREFEYNPLGQTTAITTKHDGDTVGDRVTQTYDAAGNLTHATDGTTYTYNVHNQPVTETRPDTSTITNTYWVNGQRNTITTADTTGELQAASVGLYWDGTALINDTHTTGDTTTPVTGSYLIGASRHTRTLNTDTSDTSHYVTDRHGNTTAITDNTGDVTTAYGYTDYGVTTEHTTPGHDTTPAHRNPFQYAGEYTTADDKQLLNKRTLDPTVFAFTTRDDADQFNLYSYANSNPITLTDPTGQYAQPDFIKHVAVSAAGLLMAGLGVVLSVMSFGTGLSFFALGFSVASSVADAGITAAQVANEYGSTAGFLTNKEAEILGWAGFAVGLASLALGGLSGATKPGNKKTPAPPEAPLTSYNVDEYGELMGGSLAYKLSPKYKDTKNVAQYRETYQKTVKSQLQSFVVTPNEASQKKFWDQVPWSPEYTRDARREWEDSFNFNHHGSYVPGLHRWSFPLQTSPRYGEIQKIDQLEDLAYYYNGDTQYTAILNARIDVERYFVHGYGDLEIEYRYPPNTVVTFHGDPYRGTLVSGGEF